MNEQEKREKAIKGLELCTSKIETRTQTPCETCPYHNKKYHGVLGDGCCNARSLQRDALALLKAQEPRVMTLWEAVGIIDRPVYLERNVLMPDKSVNRQECWALVQATDDEHMIRIATPYGIEKWHVGAYGIGWRCWTSRPTDEQREKVKWDG